MADSIANLSKLPVEVLKRYEKWKDIVQLSGPQGIRQFANAQGVLAKTDKIDVSY